jgi:Delta3-Delta2-enoyl-CoA isomerase
MKYAAVHKVGAVATVRINRGKVNALNPQVIDELKECFTSLEADPNVRAVVLTGSGGFFSFGFDIPEFLSYSKAEFTAFLRKFTEFYTYLFLFPKPVVAALDGHTVAGGCMLATACDYRIMIDGKAKIALNEISFGSTIFAGSVDMLKFWVGDADARNVLYTGALFSVDEALKMGLIDKKTTEEQFDQEVDTISADLAQRDPKAFQSIKLMLGKPAQNRDHKLIPVRYHSNN